METKIKFEIVFPVRLTSSSSINLEGHWLGCGAEAVPDRDRMRGRRPVGAGQPLGDIHGRRGQERIHRGRKIQYKNQNKTNNESVQKTKLFFEQFLSLAPYLN